MKKLGENVKKISQEKEEAKKLAGPKSESTK
jgi:hypothetical protein